MLDAAYRRSADITATNWPPLRCVTASHRPEAFAVAHEQRAIFERSVSPKYLRIADLERQRHLDDFARERGRGLVAVYSNPFPLRLIRPCLLFWVFARLTWFQ